MGLTRYIKICHPQIGKLSTRLSHVAIIKVISQNRQNYYTRILARLECKFASLFTLIT